MSRACAVKHSYFDLEAPHERLALIASLVTSGKNLTAAEVRQLRRALFEDESASRDEARALFDLERAQDEPCAEWTKFLIDCLTDHVVWQSRPTGEIAAEQADWLVRETESCRALTGAALLANVLAEAHRAPEWLVALARARVAAPEIHAALAGEAEPSSAD